MIIFSEIQKAIETLQIEAITGLVTDSLDRGADPMEIIKYAIAPGLEVVGEKFESSEYFLGELILAGHTAMRAMEILEKQMLSSTGSNRRSVILATVKGDMHEIGKNIVAMLLKANDFNVVDLGVDVSAKTIIQAAKENDVRLIGLSILLSSMVEHLKEVIDAFGEAGFRDRVKIVIGGPCTSERLREELGADAYAEDAVDGIEIFKRLSAKM